MVLTPRLVGLIFWKWIYLPRWCISKYSCSAVNLCTPTFLIYLIKQGLDLRNCMTVTVMVLNCVITMWSQQISVKDHSRVTRSEALNPWSNELNFYKFQLASACLPKNYITQLYQQFLILQSSSKSGDIFTNRRVVLYQEKSRWRTYTAAGALNYLNLRTRLPCNDSVTCSVSDLVATTVMNIMGIVLQVSGLTAFACAEIALYSSG